MRKSVDGSEFPDLDQQPSSTSHIDRYTKSKTAKNAAIGSKDEKTQGRES